MTQRVFEFAGFHSEIIACLQHSKLQACDRSKADNKTLQSSRRMPWPKNRRELQNIIERSVIVCETEIFSVAPAQFQGKANSDALGSFFSGVKTRLLRINTTDCEIPAISFPIRMRLRNTECRQITTTRNTGKMSGSVMTVTTKSATNQYHGLLFEYLRNEF